jgi:hypothetical protein
MVTEVAPEPRLETAWEWRSEAALATQHSTAPAATAELGAEDERGGALDTCASRGRRQERGAGITLSGGHGGCCRWC